jgi:plastocyanin
VTRVALAVLAVAVLAVACGDSDEPTETGGSPPVSIAGQTNDHGTKTATDKFEVEADDFYFGPTYIKATAGQAFTIELHNEGNTAHTFTSSVLAADEQIRPGEKKTVRLTAPETGTALFFCRFHQGQGMQGAVFVG